MKKLSKNGIFILMTVIILLQYVSPILAVANTLDEKNDLITLNTANVSKEDDQTVTVDLKVTANNATEQAKQTNIEFSNKSVMIKEILNQTTASKNQYKLNSQVFEATIAPNTSKEENNLSIKLDKASLKGIDSVELSSGDSKTTLDLSSITQLPEKSSTVPESSAKSTESSIPASSTASNSSKEDANNATVKEKKTTTARLNDVAPTPNDITTYLPDAANGTIFDSVDLKFQDSTGKEVSADNFPADGKINLKYNWSIPDQLKDNYVLKNGDYFVFSLPPKLAYVPGNYSAGEYGDFLVNSDGTVKLTFKNVENQSDINGSLSFSQSLDKTNSPGPTTIDIPTKDGEVKANIVIKPNGGNDISKAGRLDKANNPNQVFWDVTVNTSGSHLVNAKVSDALPDGNIYKSAIVYPLTIDTKGTVTATGQPLVAGTDYTVDANGTISFIGNYADTYKAFKVAYTTTISQDKKPDDGGNINFKNTATLVNGDKVATASAQVTAIYGKLLAKTFDGNDTNGSQVYFWHIDYNAGEKTLPAGTTIVDTLDGDQIFSGSPVLTDTSGKVLDKSLYTIAYSSDNKQMTVTFPNGLNQKVKVSYKSQVTTPLNDNGSTNLNNTATSNNKTVTVGSGSVAPQGLYKYVIDTDYANRTATWRLDVNPARQDMTNWSLDEVIPDGLTVDKTSIAFKFRDSNAPLKLGTDYTITDTDKGFKVAFLGDLKVKASNWYVLTFNTSFETQKIGNASKWTNNATMTWTDKFNTNHTNNASGDFKPRADYISDSSKSGSYNAVNKNISWSIYTNLNQRSLIGASITDPIQDDQDYVAGSAILYSGTINKAGDVVNLVKVDGVTPTYDATTKTVSVNLPEGSKSAYVLKFDTSLVNKVIDKKDYQNTATYVNNNKSNLANGTVSVNNGGNSIEKTGQQDPSDASLAVWNVWVNKAQSTLKDVVITDKPSSNQTVIADSIVVYGSTVAQNGTVSQDQKKILVKDADYSVDLQTNSTTGEQVLVIKFLHTIDTAYLIQYRAFINSSLVNDTLTNSVNVKGTGQKTVDNGTTQGVKVVNNSGSSSSKNINLVITKVDQDNTSKVLPGVKFELYASSNGNKGGLLRSGTTDDKGQLSWGNLKGGDYFLVETTTIAGYDIPADLAVGKKITLKASQADANSNIQLTQTNEKTKTSVKGLKSWDDNNNIEGLRPASITVNLLADGTFSQSKTVTQALNWAFSFDGLVKYHDDGTPIKYTVSEDTVRSYKSNIDQTDLSNVKIVNSRILEVISVKGSKTWDDKVNQDGIRPDNITVNLLANNVQVQTKTVSATDNWAYSFDNLNKFKDGKAIEYKVTENSVDKYSAKIDGYNITNSYTPAKTSIAVTKSWEDNNDQDGMRPTNIQVQLYANDNPSGDPVTLNAENNWQTTFTNLDLNANGQAINYQVKEVGNVAGYKADVNDTDKNNVIITNTHRPLLKQFIGTKTWDDNDNQDGVRPDSITVNLLADGEKVAEQVVTAATNWAYSFTNFPQYVSGKAINYTISEETVAGYDQSIQGYNITNTHTPETSEFSGIKTWNDNNNQDGIRPNSITVNLLANGVKVSFKEVKSTDNWQYTFINLPKFEAGKEIIYTVSEESVTGYDMTVTGKDLTNTHAPELTSVTGTKTWEDSNNQDGIRPNSITVNLLANGKQVASEDVTAESNWTYSFANLPKFEAGQAISYTISEQAVVGYDMTVNGNDLTNTHTPELTAVSGTKTWSDNNNQDGIRPDKITVNLLADGKTVMTQDVAAKDDWKYNFANLSKFAAGKVIVYTISEEKIAGYDTTINGNDLTNTHTPELTVVSGTKTWADNNNQYGIRPDKITVNLFANGTPITSKVVTAQDNWTYTFANLPKFDAGSTIVYTISEDAVKGYVMAVNGYNLTNTYVKPPTTPNKPNDNQLPKTSEIINHLYYLIGFVMLTLAGFGLVLAKKGKL
ncbi:aggregation-promoting protein [Lactococcus piscium]|uniref:Aggregation-promoting protein n=1 Tax=Pseudolactococcus piscium TaxID=1364 RepID=A0A2A5S0Q5_9LACT|nr:Cna B-type domain-containing protein [Lactococcus piscium]PCS07044.1 aggregation-promoting protein [Lactococcus piscium]